MRCNTSEKNKNTTTNKHNHPSLYAHRLGLEYFSTTKREKEEKINEINWKWIEAVQYELRPSLTHKLSLFSFFCVQIADTHIFTEILQVFLCSL